MIRKNNYSDVPADALPLARHLTLLSAALGVSILGWLADDPTALQVAVVASALIAAFLAFVDAREVWRSGLIIGRSVLLLGALYWFWIEAIGLAFKDPPFAIEGGAFPYYFNQVPADIVGMSLIAVNLFSLAAIVGWRHAPIPRGMLARLADRRDPASGYSIDIYCLVLALMGIVPIYIAFGGNVSEAWDTLYQMRSAEGYEGPDVGLAIHFQHFGIAGGAIALARSVLRLPGSRSARYLAVAATVIWVFFGASRFNLAFVLLPSILLLLLPHRDERGQTRRKTMLLVISGFVVLMLLIQGAARSIGMQEYLEEQGSSGSIKLARGGLFGHEHFSALMMAVYLVPGKHDYFMEPMAPYFITHFVPRAWWPDKTYPETWVYYNEAVTKGQPYNVTPSVIGQYYMGWGLLGVAYIGMFFGWMARFIELWLNRVDLQRQLLSATTAGLFLIFLFLSFRILYPLYFAYPLFATIAYWFFSNRLESDKPGRQLLP